MFKSSFFKFISLFFIRVPLFALVMVLLAVFKLFKKIHCNEIRAKEVVVYTTIVL